MKFAFTAAATFTAIMTATTTQTGGPVPLSDQLPKDFAASTTSWTSERDGWVLGYAAEKPVLVQTLDGGKTWLKRKAPKLTQPHAEPALSAFDTKLHGLLSDGKRLYTTADGALTWKRAPLPSSGDARVVKVAIGADRAYAVGFDGKRTALYSAPLSTWKWSTVDGVRIGGEAQADISTYGKRAYLTLGQIHEDVRYFASADGKKWRSPKPPCSVDAVTELDAAATKVYALCSSNPRIGHMDKELESSSGANFSKLGPAPLSGLTTDFAMPSTKSPTIAANGGNLGFLHASFDGGKSWSQPLSKEGPPLYDLQFTDADHGVVLRGGPDMDGKGVYRTVDGGHTWKALKF